MKFEIKQAILYKGNNARLISRASNGKIILFNNNHEFTGIQSGDSVNYYIITELHNCIHAQIESVLERTNDYKLSDLKSKHASTPEVNLELKPTKSKINSHIQTFYLRLCKHGGSYGFNLPSAASPIFYEYHRKKFKIELTLLNEE